MQIISGSSNPDLAKDISKETNIKILHTKIGKFKSGESKVQILGDIENDVIIIQSINNPVNDNLMELLLLIDAAKQAGSSNITAFIPYFGYSRQDNLYNKNESLSFNLVIKMIELAGASRIITLDLHSDKTEQFNINIINSNNLAIFAQLIKNENIAIISPDQGGKQRAKNYSDFLNADLVVINKIRDEHNKISTMEILADVKGKNCIIIDDIIDSGDTICKASELLIYNGAKLVEAIVTHAVLSDGAVQKIENSRVDKIYISNSIKQKNLPKKFIIIRCDKFLSSLI